MGEQGTQPTPLKGTKNVIEDLGKELQEIIREVNHKIVEISQEILDKFEQIKDEANFGKIITDLREKISKVDDQGEKKCVNSAEDKANTLEYELQHKIFVCKFQVYESSNGLIKKLVTVLEELKTLVKEVGEVFFTCLKGNLLNQGKFEKCLEEKAANIKQKLEEFKKSCGTSLRCCRRVRTEYCS